MRLVQLYWNSELGRWALWMNFSTNWEWVLKCCRHSAKGKRQWFERIIVTLEAAREDYGVRV